MQQARYIRTLVKPGHTIEEVADDIRLKAGEIRNFLKTDTMMQLAHLMPLEDEVRAALDNKDKFSLTTLERLIQSADGQKFLGITFDADGNAVGDYETEEFKKAYSRILRDIAAGTIDTRKLNSSAEIRNYLKGFGKSKPDRTKKATWTSVSLLSGKTKAAKEALTVANKPKTVVQRDDPFLVPRGFRCELKQPRIKEVFGELRRMKRREFPNGCAVLTRIFVELVIGYYLDKTGKIQPLLDKAKKDKKPADWYPTLSQMMNSLLQDSDISLKPLARKALNKMVTDDQSVLSLEHLNQFVHNRYMAPTDRELGFLWAKLEPLLEILMEEPKPRPAK